MLPGYGPFAIALAPIGRVTAQVEFRVHVDQRAASPRGARLRSRCPPDRAGAVVDQDVDPLRACQFVAVRLTPRPGPVEVGDHDRCLTTAPFWPDGSRSVSLEGGVPCHQDQLRAGRAAYPAAIAAPDPRRASVGRAPYAPRRLKRFSRHSQVPVYVAAVHVAERPWFSPAIAQIGSCTTRVVPETGSGFDQLGEITASAGLAYTSRCLVSVGFRRAGGRSARSRGRPKYRLALGPAIVRVWAGLGVPGAAGRADFDDAGLGGARGRTRCAVRATCRGSAGPLAGRAPAAEGRSGAWCGVSTACDRGPAVKRSCHQVVRAQRGGLSIAGHLGGVWGGHV
jgi:hypothetical protein